VTAAVADKAATAAVRIDKESTPEPPTPARNATKLVWSGEVAPQKWSQLYMKVLTRLVSGGEVRLQLRIEATPKNGVSDQQVDETKAALRGLGLDDDVKTD
jgi:hypothetical protein